MQKTIAAKVIGQQAEANMSIYLPSGSGTLDFYITSALNEQVWHLK